MIMDIAWVYVCLHRYACGSQRSFLGIVPQEQPTLFSQKVISLLWNLPSRLAWLASKPKEAARLRLPGPGTLWYMHQHTAAKWEMSAGPLACKASTLPSQPSL